MICCIDEKLLALFKPISLGENPLDDHGVTEKEALRVKEKSGMGEDMYNEWRKVSSKAKVNMPSLYKLNKYRQANKPKIENFEKGKWISLYPTVKSTLQEIFEVHNIKPKSGHLNGFGTIGFDLSGTHKQFQFKEIKTDTTKIIYGSLKYVLFNQIGPEYLVW